MFTNPEIALEQLPDMEALDWQGLHPRYVRRLQLQLGMLALIPIIGATVFTLLVDAFLAVTAFFWFVTISLTIFFVVWPMIAVPRCGYVVRDKDVVFRKGVIWRSVTAIPFNRVQHVETSSTPLDRKFALATLQLFTAGGSGGDLRIAGLGSDTAERLRIFVLGKTGASIERD